MKTVQLVRRAHSVVVSDKCPYIEPNITDDCLLVENGELLGFYIKDISTREKMCKLLSVANAEFMSDRVPKTLLERSDVMIKQQQKGISRQEAMNDGVCQYSTIIGSVQASGFKRRFTNRTSIVHANESAQYFIKAMYLLSVEAANLIKEYMPDAYYELERNMKSVPAQRHFGKLWTSSICNYNNAAPFHIDRSNLPASLNVIFTKRYASRGGSLCIPDYGAVFEQGDNSMLVYPAWRNMHGVTEIEPLFKGGYRNSLILYALNLRA
jgi:hypothetical protein